MFCKCQNIICQIAKESQRVRGGLEFRRYIFTRDKDEEEEKVNAKGGGNGA